MSLHLLTRAIPFIDSNHSIDSLDFFYLLTRVNSSIHSSHSAYCKGTPSGKVCWATVIIISYSTTISSISLKLAEGRINGAFEVLV